MNWSHVDFLWIIVMFWSAVWSLILTAPIHYRVSIGEQGGYIFSKTIPLINMAKRHNQACVNNLPLISFYWFIFVPMSNGLTNKTQLLSLCTGCVLVDPRG